MSMCLNKKVIAGLGVVGVGVLLFAPNAIGAALPLLILAACPLSMIFMMRAMSNGQSSCSAGDEQRPQPEQKETMDELAALRAEVQHLRAEQAGRGAAVTPTELGGRP